jgi:hypothetical protein
VWLGGNARAAAAIKATAISGDASAQSQTTRSLLTISHLKTKPQTPNN